MSHIFISYSKKDRAYARSLANRLLELGFDVWIDEVIEPGDGWFRSIRAAIKDCAAFVLVMTPESESSHWVNLELLHALEYHKPIFPLLRAGSPNPLDSDVWAQIATIQFTDVRDDSMPSERFYERLINRGVPRKVSGGVDVTPAPSVVGDSEGWSATSADNAPDWLNAMSPGLDVDYTPLEDEPVEREFVKGGRTAPSLRVPDLSGILPPPFEWCGIPAGQVTLRAGGYVPVGGKTFDVPAFVIARYPITNAQFAVFVASKDGYANPKWWDYSDNAKTWKERYTKPENPASDSAEGHPRTNVSWYEAVAFCRWLTARLVEQQGFMTVQITLPTEQQWQRAAQGDDGRVYPWGSTFDTTFCNTRESGIEKTTLVTAYPAGAGPYGVLDMAGNVWEWCLTSYKTGLSDENKGSGLCVLRGGSFNNDQSFAACASRHDFSPRHGSRYYGFRVVCDSVSV